MRIVLAQALAEVIDFERVFRVNKLGKLLIWVSQGAIDKDETLYKLATFVIITIRIRKGQQT